jgi:hypothetical protein
MKRFLASALLLLTFAFSPTVAAAAEAWGYFQCTVEIESQKLFVHSKPESYSYVRPAAPNDTIDAVVDFSFALVENFKGSLENRLVPFTELVEEATGQPCIDQSRDALIDGPFEALKEAQAFIALAAGKSRVLEVDSPVNQ